MKFQFTLLVLCTILYFGSSFAQTSDSENSVDSRSSESDSKSSGSDEISNSNSNSSESDESSGSDSLEKNNSEFGSESDEDDENESDESSLEKFSNAVQDFIDIYYYNPIAVEFCCKASLSYSTPMLIKSKLSKEDILRKIKFDKQYRNKILSAKQKALDKLKQVKSERD